MPVLETTVVPRPPYWLALSARLRSDPTRVFRDGVLTMALDVGGPALARVYQRPDSSLAVRIEGSDPDAAVELVHFVLAADDDHGPFLRRFERDPLLAEPLRRLRGLRPLRTQTVVHALLKAVCGQLIQAKAARQLEARLLRLAAPHHEGFCLPPTRTTFAGFAPAQLQREGLVARKATSLVRLCREWDVERLRGVDTETAGRRIERARPRPLVSRHGLPLRARTLGARGSSATSASSSSARPCAVARRSRTTRASCSSPTASGRGWQASTCLRAGLCCRTSARSAAGGRPRPRPPPRGARGARAESP